MPTALRVEGFRFFYAADCSEPIHIHVTRGEGLAKVWLETLTISSPWGFAHTKNGVSYGSQKPTRTISSPAGMSYAEDTMYDTFLSAETASVDGDKRIVKITLKDGQVYECSLADVSDRLRLVHPSLLEDWEWIGPRAGMHWPAVDEDLSVGYLVAKGTRRNEPDANTENLEMTHQEPFLTSP